MDEQKRPRAWVYARIPGDYDGTMNSYKICSMQALHDGCDIVGGSIDERGGWLLRPGYRDMLRQIKAGKVDRVYICRMRQEFSRKPTRGVFSVRPLFTVPHKNLVVRPPAEIVRLSHEKCVAN